MITKATEKYVISENFRKKCEYIIMPKAMFVCGGYNVNKTVCCSDTYEILLDNKEFTCNKKQDMLMERYHHTLVKCENVIFCIGGKSIEETTGAVEFFAEDKWERAPDLLVPTEKNAAVYYQDAQMIYVFGGCIKKEFSNLILSLHVPDGIPAEKWEQIQIAFPQECKPSLAVVYHDKILLLGGSLRQECWEYKPGDKLIRNEQLLLPSRLEKFIRGSVFSNSESVYLISQPEKNIYCLCNDEWSETKYEDWNKI